MIDISLFASAVRPKWWQRLYDSLKDNKCKWEIVFVGDKKPEFSLPSNFRWEHCPFKPSQCYAAASYLCQGRLIGYIADDAVYAPKALDYIVDVATRYGKKFIFTQKTIENGKDVSEEHHFFRHSKDTPMMAPMAFLNREWFWELGGYDRNFISGQAENLICLDALTDGGRIINVPQSKVFLNHEEVHGGFWNKLNYKFGKRSFRKGYFSDRRYLEENYVVEGYGTYNERSLKHGIVSKKRLLCHHPYNYSNILIVGQGKQGYWECHRIYIK